jgi:hypothetical protein
MDRLTNPKHYLDQFNSAADRLEQLLQQNEVPKFLQRERNGDLIGFDLDGSRIKVSKSLERKLLSGIESQITEEYFDDLAAVDMENMSDVELQKFIKNLKLKTSIERDKAINYKSQFEKLRSSKRNIFELDTSNPKKFAEGLLGVLNPEESADFMLIIIFQMWADITNSPKIPGIDIYIDTIAKIGAFEANPLSANGWFKAELNDILEKQGSTPWRKNGLQDLLEQYNKLVIEPRGCSGKIKSDGTVLATEKDLYLDISLPVFGGFKLLPNGIKNTFQIREYSWAEVSYKARLVKLVELAYEKGMVHSLVNHTSGTANVFEIFRDVLGVPNFFAGSPKHH